jgi:hypothetical protein
MSEYAIRFYLLLDHAVRLQAQESYQALIAASFPHLKDRDRKDLMKKYLKLIDGVDDVDVQKDRERLRRLMRGKMSV